MARVARSSGLLALTVCALMWSAAGVSAQAPLTPADYGQWERLGAHRIDRTGSWLVVAITRVDGSRELRLRAADGDGQAVVLEHAAGAVFSDDGRWMAYRQGVSADEQDAADERIPDQLGLYDLNAGADTTLFELGSFAFRDDGVWLAVHGAAPSDSVGGDLVVLNPATGAQNLIGNVDDFAWQEEGDLLAATLSTAGGIANGVVLFDPEAGTLRTLDSRGADYAALTWDDDSDRLAVMRSVGRLDPDVETTMDVLIWDDVTSGDEPDVLSGEGRTGFGGDLRITDYNGIDFADGTGVVFVGLRPWDRAEEEEEDENEEGDSSDDDDGADDVAPADVQVWHWDDDLIIRAQEWRAGPISRQTYLAAWHRTNGRLVPLGEDLDEPVQIVSGGAWGIVGVTDPYDVERRWGARTTDWYRVDVSDGSRTQIVSGIEGGLTSSWDQDRVLYHREGWHVVDLPTLDTRSLAGGTDFTQPLEDYDYPGPRPSYGFGGWLEGEEAVLVYDKHDVYRVDIRDGDATRLTDGSETGRVYRVVDLDRTFPDPISVPGNRPLILSHRHMTTKSSGYATVDPDGDGGVETLIDEDARVAGLVEAEGADRVAFRMERWDDSPDVFTADREFEDRVQVTNTNPFQSDYAWGHSELLDYTTDAGHDLQAILAYPADFQEGRQYPLILYQYERLSNGLHTYQVPSERAYYSYQAWSQAGYFVLMPDIVYEPGRPGPSALDAVEHALDAAIATGHVDADAMGLIGHSWGGYQASYLPTRTDRFAASVAGAAITNFLSFMGQVHWNGGVPETSHWEMGQGRMAVPMWEDLEGHLESSPANFIQDLETPMLLMHGDADGVVDFYQGMEFYQYARRAGKEVVLLVYPGADHGLSDESQQVDYHRRILEWFGHYLKGDEAPKWITDGESWVERGKRIEG